MAHKTCHRQTLRHKPCPRNPGQAIHQAPKKTRRMEQRLSQFNPRNSNPLTRIRSPGLHISPLFFELNPGPWLLQATKRALTPDQ